MPAIRTSRSNRETSSGEGSRKEIEEENQQSEVAEDGGVDSRPSPEERRGLFDDHSPWWWDLVAPARHRFSDNVRAVSGGPFAAVIVRDANIVGTGVNRVTSSNDPTAHAEVVAIREACQALGAFQLTGCDLYTTCEPCPMCLGAIYWARPARVFYAGTAADAAAAGFDDAFIYDELKSAHAARSIPMAQLLRD